MSKKLFLVFTQMGKLPPKLYTRQSFVDRLIQKDKTYKFQCFQNQFSASNAMFLREAQHEKYKLNQKKKQLQEKIKSLNKNNLKNSETQNNTTKSQNKLSQLASSISTNNSSENIENKSSQKKGLTQIKLKKQSLYHLSPSMQRLLAYYTPTVASHPVNPRNLYTGFFDGCSKFNPGPSGVGYYILDKQQTLLEACWPLGNKTNNQSQFTALLYLLADAHLNNIKNIHIYGDSKLTIDYASGKLRISHPNIIEYADAVNKLLRLFPYKKLQFILRKYNSIADKLSNEALRKKFENQKFVEIKN